ncbi:MAG: isochorismatase family protein, partial [Spirochaetales bacterium]|nr:isochorismatase family protein [Spirochaetales bacterium]
NEFYIAGADAAACVKSTCYNMSKAGYTVHVISDCITSYDLKKMDELYACSRKTVLRFSFCNTKRSSYRVLRLAPTGTFLAPCAQPAGSTSRCTRSDSTFWRKRNEIGWFRAFRQGYGEDDTLLQGCPWF